MNGMREAQDESSRSSQLVSYGIFLQYLFYNILQSFMIFGMISFRSLSLMMHRWPQKLHSVDVFESY